MRWSRCRVAPAGRSVWLLAVLGPLGLSIALTGCAASSVEPDGAPASVQADRLSEAEASRVMARAIVAHETRRP
jgi:hypothetical protein